MNNLIDTIKYKNHDIKIYIDEYNDNPLEWSKPEERKAWFVMSHSRYHVPNELDIEFDKYSSWQEVADHVYKKYKYVCKFVRWYEHGGIAVSLRDDTNVNDWDAGIVGCIFGETTKDIENSFLDWQAYVQGDIYSFSTDFDACGGYFGEAGYKAMIEEAKQGIDAGAKQEAKDKMEITTAKRYAKKHGYILAQEVTK